MYIFPAQATKIIRFNRMCSKHVESYEIYASFKDSTCPSGIRTELIDVVANVSQSNPILNKIELQYNKKASWEAPGDMLLDRDHQFNLYMNGELLSTMVYKYNRHKKIIAIDTVMQNYTLSDKVELEYYQDLIEINYTPEDGQEVSDIFVKPIFTEHYLLGSHNIIM